ncbi:hypothetical protein [Streptomyces sp. NPDC048282]|uniref:hypothetical protein n=1 Tax=Streptomyces sp. NPDC048282 TaxID=3365528 RepID=UPI0037237D7E
MTLHSVWLPPAGQTRQATRLASLGATTPSGPLQSRSGILPGHDDPRYRVGGFVVSGVTGGMTAGVSHGRAVIQGTVTQGAYPVALDEDITVTFPDGDAQYNRIDLLVLRVYDDAYDGSGRTEATVEIIRGTPAATPAVPALPALALALAQVTVRAGTGAGSGGIDWANDRTDLRTTLVSVGGILPVYNNATVAGGYPGHYQDNDVLGYLQRWNGTAWVAYPKALGGIAPAGIVSTGGYTGQYRDSSLGVLQRWNGSAWQPAIAPPPFVASQDAGHTTSTTYTAALTDTAVTALTLAFTAPATGAVLLHFGARMLTQSSTIASAFMTPQVTQGSTVVLSANDEVGASHSGTAYSSVSTVYRLAALTPGTSYTVTAMHRSSDAGVIYWFDNMFMRVDPAN